MQNLLRRTQETSETLTVGDLVLDPQRHTVVRAGKPIKLIGTGEKLDALEDFYPQRIADRILGMGDIISLVEKAAATIDAEKAARAYKDINLLGFKMLRPGGLLFTFSCSGGVSRELFQKIVAGAALDAGVDARIVNHLSAGADHPVALNFPEGEYLKGLICSRG